MRTTLDLDEELLNEAMKASGAPTKSSAIRQGLRKLVEEAARKRLAALGGSMPTAKPARRRRSSVGK
jgi:Arc/MetJ family transcription regulator